MKTSDISLVFAIIALLVSLIFISIDNIKQFNECKAYALSHNTTVSYEGLGARRTDMCCVKNDNISLNCFKLGVIK